MMVLIRITPSHFLLISLTSTIVTFLFFLSIGISHNLLFTGPFLPQDNIFLIFLSGLWIDPINSETLGALDQTTGAIWVDDLRHANPTCENTIQRKALNNLVTHATNVHLRVTRDRLGEGALVAVYCPEK